MSSLLTSTLLGSGALPDGLYCFSDCVADETDRGDARARMREGYLRHGQILSPLGLHVTDFIDVDYHPGGDPNDAFAAGATLLSLVDGTQPDTQEETELRFAFTDNSSPRREMGGVNGHKMFAATAYDSLIVATWRYELIEILHRAGLVDQVALFDQDDVTGWAVLEGIMNQPQADKMRGDQFRGARYLAWLLAQLLKRGLKMPYSTLELEKYNPNPAARRVVARLDSGHFGPNVYTDVFTSEIVPGAAGLPLVNGLVVPVYPGLAKIPPGKAGFAPGSTGNRDDKLLMLAVNGGSGRDWLQRQLGTEVVVGAEILHPSALAA